ncbi:DUF222 domain-containing protein [Georgenia yuyongxinii]|uniref:DUF222 domain-containing protein n=1 Tax=Georgenia yuyongxinii TaxID=2589797 RepID=A0A5B8C176_9MICO|nr:DUF222 domain-containing protein [Georgenia yuyongxinii]QDC24489.1 DUF222 domain-containing protein [Georgenia yuyongxinii]
MFDEELDWDGAAGVSAPLARMLLGVAAVPDYRADMSYAGPEGYLPPRRTAPGTTRSVGWRQAELDPQLSDFQLTTLAAIRLESLTPGAGMVAVPGSLDGADVDDQTLVEAIAAHERLMAWGAATQARLVAELVARRPAASPGPTPLHMAAFELQARLGTTRYGAEAKVSLAVELENFPRVADALATGKVDVNKAKVLLHTTPGLPDAELRRIHDTLLPDAATLTGPQLRDKLRHAALLVDPDAVAKRHAKSFADRTVTIEPAYDGMSWVSALLRCDDAEAVRTYVDALGTAAKASGDRRTADQRRADAFRDLFRTLLDRGLDLDGAELPMFARRRPHLQVTIGAGSLLGLDDQPGLLAGYGPISADLAREIATDATWQALFTDATTGEVTAVGTKVYRPGIVLARTVIARDVTCTFMGCRMPAYRCDLDHTPEYDATKAATVQQTRLDTLYARCRSHHGAKTIKARHVERDPETGDSIWTAPTGHQYRRRADKPPGTTPPDPPDSTSRGAPVTAKPPPPDPMPPPRPRASGTPAEAGADDPPPF